MSEDSVTGSETGERPIDVRLRIAALWAATMFIFAYVDIFGFFRVDTLNSVLAGKISAFQIDQTFLLLTTIYVAIPSLMVVLSLMLPRAINRWTNIILPILFALSIIASCIGEMWIYYIVGSAIEVVLLVTIAWLAWTWRPTS